MLLVDTNDKDDKNDCTADSCDASGKVTHNSSEAGTLCPGTPTDYGQCDGQGHCVDCVNSGGCEESSDCGPNNTCHPS
jgi:hypothetical protein